eukprot:TRINITY_DN5111_c0_g1_i1.p1 TRINITY_DN5111_c0_g1~~TRINITY_DN5111_c0_g1_i1.p1  ORF type:complete len:284 (+),score=38.68 TRINITY_DN5111_c0_g1_i1:18-869(+)
MKFELTTQARFWLFTEQELIEKKIETNMKGAGGNPNIPNRMTVEEESVYKDYLAEKVVSIVSQLKCSRKVLATALVYFRRFYLYNSVMDYDGFKVLFTCVFIAAKVEEERKEIRSFIDRCGYPKLTHDSLVSTEYILLDGLKFHLDVIHPYMPLEGFYVDMQSYVNSTGDGLEKYRSQMLEFIKLANDLVNNSIDNEAFFFFPPSQIAIAAMKKAVLVYPEISEFFNSYIESKLKVNFPNWNEIELNIERIEPYLKKKVSPKDDPNLKPILKSANEKYKTFHN